MSNSTTEVVETARFTKDDEHVVIPYLLRDAPDPTIMGNGQRIQMAKALRPVEKRYHGLLRRLIDTHSHMIVAEREENGSRRRLRAKAYVLVTTKPADWAAIPSLVKTGGGRVIPAFGVHPQCADGVEVGEEDDAAPPHWVRSMRSYLTQHKRAIVGEIGLDRNRRFKAYFHSNQLYVFRAQLRMAVAFQRPVSVHSVKADGAIVDMLLSERNLDHRLPPTICLHSFAGSVETLCRIISIVEGPKRKKGQACDDDRSSAVRVFLGMNGWTNLFRKNATSFVRSCRDNVLHGMRRFVIESDWHPSDWDFEGSRSDDADKILLNGVLDLSQMLEMSDVESCARMLIENTASFLRPVLTRDCT